jgi:hypothetical protein
MSMLMSKVNQETKRLFDIFRQSPVRGKLSLYTFSTNLRHAGTWDFQNLPAPPHLYADDMTRLYDSIHDVCESMWLGSSDTFALHVLTDGQNNVHHGRPRDTMKKLMRKPNWTFGIVGPETHQRQMANDLGIDKKIILPWDGQSEESYAQTQVATQSSFTSYLDALSRGATKVDKFYASAKADFSNLPFLTPAFKEYKVDADNRIDEFVQRKTKRQYVKGTAYYELIKEEVVQKNKDILVQHKVNHDVRGPVPRKDLGLPDYEDAKVTPGNFGDWRVYVQSQAVNRKLPRGSRVLVRK